MKEIKLLILAVIFALMMLGYGVGFLIGDSVRASRKTQQVEEEFTKGIPWGEKKSFLALDRCDVYPFRSGLFLICLSGINNRVQSFQRMLEFADGLTAIEEMGYEVRMQIPVEQLPNHMMIVWATKKEPE